MNIYSEVSVIGSISLRSLYLSLYMLQVLARTRAILASGDISDFQSIGALTTKMYASSAAQHPAAECLQGIVETARKVEPTPSMTGLNTIGEFESFVATREDIMASPFAEPFFWEAIGSINAHRHAVNADPSMR